MHLRVLGCSGGISNLHQTTALLLNDDILIDAGTGVSSLSLDEMARIRHVFLTHSHLDHVACLPLMLDSVFDRLPGPVTVHGHPQTLQALREHIFNNTIWPDFSKLPSPEHPVLRYEPFEPGETIEIDGRRLLAISVNHTVPAMAYRVESDGVAFAFSGDTTTNDTLWQTLNAHPPVQLLILETAFPDADEALSRLARHYCPKLLAEDLAKLDQRPPIYLSHPKPGDEETIFEQLRHHIPDRDLHRLCPGDEFEL